MSSKAFIGWKPDAPIPGQAHPPALTGARHSLPRADACACSLLAPYAVIVQNAIDKPDGKS